ncbi:helix-turn-helix domain-containing protein [Streptomyces sp. NPDC094153]|uniref:helix-turn-helix domain-containing protein n=1 Tax=Streptomyces sp. NPDC094153 TaxID=3366058 RepID=UPI0037F3E459
MSESEAPPTDTPPGETVQDPPHPYDEQALARIMLSEAHREVADLALHGIATWYDKSPFAGQGSYVEEAARLVSRAEDVLRWAAVYERERGTSWEDIGTALGVTRQTAHERFSGAVARWREPLDNPERYRSDGTPDDERMPYAVRYICGSHGPEESMCEQTAKDLEQWLKQRTAPGDSWADEEHPVTGALTRNTTTIMLMRLSDISSRLLDEQMVPDPRAEADMCERRVALYERLIRENEAVPADVHKWIERDRARAAALRATPGTGVPWPANSADQAPANKDQDE